MKCFILFISLVSSFKTFAECVPAHEYFPFSGSWVTKNDNGDVELGMYSRMSPDGKYVLRSNSGRKLSTVTLMEHVRGETNSVKPYETPLKNEAFPVQGSWRYLVDTSGEYYKLTDIIANQKEAKRQFKGGISGFYTVAAELKGGTPALHRIRTLSWPAGNEEMQGVGVLSNRIVTASLDKNGKASRIDNGSLNYMCRNLSSSDGQTMSLPMISLDGSEFSSMPQNPKNSEVSMRIYKFGADDKSCLKADDLKVLAAKITFSAPQTNSVLFYASGSMGNRGNGIYFYDRDVKKIFSLDDDQKRVQADSYPGYTSDGRILYAATWQECEEKGCVDRAGYVISDPNQSSDIKEFKATDAIGGKKFKECVTKEEIQKTSEEQKKIWSYSL